MSNPTTTGPILPQPSQSTLYSAYPSADEISAAGGPALHHHLDTSSVDYWRDAMVGLLERFGRLDNMLTAAGVSGRGADGATSRPIANLDLENWDYVMAVNATGVFLGTKHAIEPMLAAGGGSIINISSIYGIVGSIHNAAYHASKGALRTFTKSAAAQYATQGIRLNSVHPGFVDTPMTRPIHDDPERAEPRLAQTPVGRFGQPDDIAYGCLFLASDESAWMTGAELVIDGGMTAV
ncbi:MAG: SDR family oxidoreductase [Gammaproteobacteria bacterium]|nr:SDR family oxidoreductase [Gammaproteobacteria bacterium]